MKLNKKKNYNLIITLILFLSFIIGCSITPKTAKSVGCSPGPLKPSESESEEKSSGEQNLYEYSRVTNSEGKVDIYHEQNDINFTVNTNDISGYPLQDIDVNIKIINNVEFRISIIDKSNKFVNNTFIIANSSQHTQKYFTTQQQQQKSFTTEKDFFSNLVSYTITLTEGKLKKVGVIFTIPNIGISFLKLLKDLPKWDPPSGYTIKNPVYKYLGTATFNQAQNIIDISSGILLLITAITNPASPITGLISFSLSSTSLMIETIKYFGFDGTKKYDWILFGDCLIIPIPIEYTDEILRVLDEMCLLIPASPSNLSIDTSIINTLTVKWDSVYSSRGYKIYRNDKFIGDTTSTFYKDSPLLPNTFYSYQISSYNKVGESSKTQPKTATTKYVDISPFYRLYRNDNIFFYKRDHFYTISENEKNYAINNGYQYEGIEGHIFKSKVEGTVKLYRLYHSGDVDHFYTIYENKKIIAESVGYKEEYPPAGYVYVVEVDGTQPLYRLYHPIDRDHFYTISVNKKKEATDNGYQYEGIEGYVIP